MARDTKTPPTLKNRSIPSRLMSISAEVIDLYLDGILDIESLRVANDILSASVRLAELYMECYQKKGKSKSA